MWLPDPITCAPSSYSVLRCRIHTGCGYDPSRIYLIHEADICILISVCGVETPRLQPLVVNGMNAHVGDFPWHATLYSSRLGMRKEFICGATIIRTNLLLTAAHCVYDEAHGTTVNPKTLFVLTGNMYRDYDSPLNANQTVSKSAVCLSCDIYFHDIRSCALTKSIRTILRNLRPVFVPGEKCLQALHVLRAKGKLSIGHCVAGIANAFHTFADTSTRLSVHFPIRYGADSTTWNSWKNRWFWQNAHR